MLAESTVRMYLKVEETEVLISFTTVDWIYWDYQD